MIITAITVLVIFLKLDGVVDWHWALILTPTAIESIVTGVTTYRRKQFDREIKGIFKQRFDR